LLSKKIVTRKKIRGESPAPHVEKRVLILTADAGFGHRSAANAIAAVFEEMDDARYVVSVVNPHEHPKTPSMMRKSQYDYDKAVRESPQLYRLGYKASDTPVPAALMDSALTVIFFETMDSVLDDHQPDIIITTYPLYLPALDTVFTLTQKYIPVVTVTTDMVTVHRVWFHATSAITTVATENVRQLAIENNIKEDRIAVTGIPVHPRIAADTRTKAEVRRDLGWDEELETILVVGSKRVSRLSDHLRVLNHSNLPIQLVLVAGGDDELYKSFQSNEWHLPVHIYNFVDNMPAFLKAADCVVCKAGGLITTESLASGTPMLLVDVLPGQEEGNATHVIDNKAGALVKMPVDLLETVYDWMADDAKLLAERSKAATRIGKPKAAHDVVSLALSLAELHPDARTRYHLRDAASLSSLLEKFDIPWRQLLGLPDES